MTNATYLALILILIALLNFRNGRPGRTSFPRPEPTRMSDFVVDDIPLGASETHLAEFLKSNGYQRCDNDSCGNIFWRMPGPEQRKKEVQIYGNQVIQVRGTRLLVAGKSFPGQEVSVATARLELKKLGFAFYHSHGPDEITALKLMDDGKSGVTLHLIFTGGRFQRLTIQLDSGRVTKEDLEDIRQGTR